MCGLWQEIHFDSWTWNCRTWIITTKSFCKIALNQRANRIQILFDVSWPFKADCHKANWSAWLVPFFGISWKESVSYFKNWTFTAFTSKGEWNALDGCMPVVCTCLTSNFGKWSTFQVSHFAILWKKSVSYCKNRDWCVSELIWCVLEIQVLKAKCQAKLHPHIWQWYGRDILFDLSWPFKADCQNCC